MEGTENSYVPFVPPQHAQPPSLSTLPPGSTFVTADEPTRTHHHHPESTVYLRDHSWCWILIDLDKCTRTCICHYRITQRIFAALKILCAPLGHPLLCPTPTTPDLFTVSIDLPFPECNITGIIVCHLSRLASFT